MRKPIRKRIVRQKKLPKLNFELTYKNYESLKTYVSDRAKIVGRKRSGLTPKEQRLLAREIKRARFLGLLPYKAKM